MRYVTLLLLVLKKAALHHVWLSVVHRIKHTADPSLFTLLLTGHWRVDEDRQARLAERHAVRVSDLQVLWDLTNVGTRRPTTICSSVLPPQHLNSPPVWCLTLQTWRSAALLQRFLKQERSCSFSPFLTGRPSAALRTPSTFLLQLVEHLIPPEEMMVQKLFFLLTAQLRGLTKWFISFFWQMMWQIFF